MEKILVLDFGGQYNQLIARRVRDHHVYAEILPYTTDLETIKKNDYKGIIFTGGPNSVYDMASPHYTKDILNIGVPILGICYGCQLIAWMGDGEVKTAPQSEYGKIEFTKKESKLFKDVDEKSVVWMSHTDYISTVPEGFEIIGTTDACPCAAMQNVEKNIYAVQFHPEVTHSVFGSQMLYNFLYEVCGCKGDWVMDNFIENTVAKLREQIGDKKVILGLSGGVDSSVAAVLLNKAIGKNLTCIFVDHGMLRKNEFRDVMEDYKCLGLNVIGVDASEKFFADLAGVTDPEKKRKIIGRDFVEVFNAEAKKQTGAKWLAQGTIYPDRIESLNITGKVIKSHHNVGGLPKEMNLQLCEPLKWLFKDEVRRVGRSMGMPEHLITRHPFPGPGLAVRILGDITPEKVRILQDADDIYIRGLREYKVKLSGEEARRVLAAGVPADMQNGEIEVSLYDQIWQAGTVLLSTVRSVGVMGDERTYEHPVALRAVTSTDAMTADWAHLPYDFMAKVSNEIINKVKGVNRVCYDISSKPPSTIEWE